MNKSRKAVHFVITALMILISINCGLISPLAIERKPTATPPPYPADWVLLLTDNFDDNSNEWGSWVPDDATGTISSRVENGLLNVTLISKAQGARNSVFQTKVTHLMDFYISFEANQNISESDAYFGLEFRTIDLQGYVFMIDQKHSQYSLAFVDTGWRPIIDLTTSTAINSDKPNKIGLLINGSAITMFINDQEIAKISDSRSANSGTFGFTVGLFNPNGKTDVSFDNLQIYGPSTPSKVPTLTQRPPIVTSTALVTEAPPNASPTSASLATQTSAPAANSDCLASSGPWSTTPDGKLSIMFTVQDCRITTVFIMGTVNGQWLIVSEEINEPINGSEFNFLHSFSDQDRYSLNGTFTSPTSAAIQLVIFKGFRFTTDQPSPLNEDLIIDAIANLGEN